MSQPPHSSVCVSSFDIIGDIAILSLPDELRPQRHSLASLLQQRLPYVATVLEQIGSTTGDFRTRQLEWIGGEKKTCTVHRESGCSYLVDLALTYFSPRLSYERTRVARLVASKSKQEIILNYFSGVGCFSILAAKMAPRSIVYSMDINPHAIRCMLTNVRANAVCGRVIPIHGDSQKISQMFFTGVADRVLLPLPERSLLYVATAVSCIKREGGMIHLYDFAEAPDGCDPPQVVAEKIPAVLRATARPFAIRHKRVVRSVGPRRYLVALDIEIFGTRETGDT